VPVEQFLGLVRLRGCGPRPSGARGVHPVVARTRARARRLGPPGRRRQ
jgi:hypothetical protein